MWKPLVVLAIVANSITQSKGTDPGPYPENIGSGNTHRKCRKPNEIYDLCPNPCPPRECGVDKSLILCAPPPKPGSSDCKPGCRCEDGFLKNNAGVCIPEDECQYDCAKNETLDPCFSDCPPRLCGVNIAAISCLAIEECDCVPGCRCSDGYLRNIEGNCVLEEDCPQCSGPNEVYDICPAPCPPRLCGVDETLIDCQLPPRPGDPECEPGCRCVDGYVRNAEDICVTKDQCQYDCARNETLDPCFSDCPPRLCGVNIAAISCLAIEECDCVPGCRCSDGYLKNIEGNCVLEEDCPQCSGPNEVYDICPAPCPPRLCGVDETLIDCQLPPRPGDPECEPGCRCVDGYVRNAEDICVTKDQCQYDCARNETLDPCFSDCPSRLCGVNIAAISCLAIEECDCVPGCRCSDGYLKNIEGNCVLEEDCPQCSGPNEVYDICPAPCPPRLCGVDETLIDCQLPPRPGDPECEPGCRCVDGYVRNAEGICVTKDQCPQCTGPNEVYDICPNPCPPQRCDVDPRVIRCAAPPKPGDPECEPGCRCLDGYVRNEDDICVTRDQCVSCRGDFNAEPGCDKNCAQRCPSPKPAECKCYKDSCKCKKEFVFDPKINKCVRPEECVPPCGKNEVLSNCSNGGCGPWRCSDVGIPTGCVKMDPKYCIVDCVCKEGYVRDENEVCIPVTDCPECGGDPNAIAGCGINCGRLCSNYKEKNVSCIAVCYENACDCRKDFVLDENINKCVRPEDCTPVCGKNEVFSECVNGGCDAKYCSQIGEPVPCVRPAKCEQGCLCADGYLRDDNGVCTPKDQCPPKCTGANEIYDPCPPTCPPQTCESIGQKYFCPLMLADKSSKDCQGACRCKPNYLRNKIGECISARDCLKCTGPNEYFSCGGACDNVCATLSEQNQTNCPIINIQCNEMCYCEEGYARDKYNICIPIDQCPGKCSENERWEECPARLCSPQSCKDLGFDIPCNNAENSTCPGLPGCVCDYNFVRDENGKCIPEKECPSCGGDPNAEAGCGLNCGRLCSNYNEGPVPCPRICYPNACDCKKDYVFDENIKKCVLPEECTPVCKEHEVYSECTNGGCQARNCTQLEKPVPCIKLDPESCIKGCVCEDGYLRARNGTCVPEEKCDLKCRGPHEYFSCGGACDNVCATLDKQNQTNCPIKNIKCNPMCYCEEGYARNKNNICIPIDKCPKPRCGVNERLEQCPPGLCTPQNCSELGFPLSCPDLPEYGCPEPPGCVCIDNYVRDCRGRCIPSHRCPSCGGDPNAVAGCGVNCGRTCSTYNSTDVACIQVCYFNACDCRKGYVFDENLKICVRPKDCTPICGKNEVYDSCANGGCGKWNCSQLGQPDLCIDPIKCLDGCICQNGYLRAENGTCVPIDQCPIPACDENERFEFCPDTICEPQTCSELGFPIDCPLLEGVSSCTGEPACICDYGFVRNDNGVCTPKKQCPSCGGDPNAESGCGINCGRLCSDYDKRPVPCPKICKLNSCDCKKGYVFDTNTKKCVRPKQCTPICGKDEAFSECINGGCQAKNCSQLGKPIPCVKMDPKYCIKGCLCKEGYLRESNGVCVPEEKCGRNCWGAHEVYDPCPPSCSPQTCESIGKKYNCPLMKIDEEDCEPACRCKEGYFRNKIGQCISKANCLKCKGPNEYFSCGGACDNVCETLYEQNQTNCPIVNIKCNPMCYCEQGYARDENNICIPIDQCPPPTCGENERFENCPDWLCSPQYCSEVGYPIPCPAFEVDFSSNSTCPGKPGCVCIDNYVRCDCGECVPIHECPSCGGDPNAVSGCGVNCGRLCSNYKEENVVCPLICKINGCDCREGFVYDSNIGKCVQPEECSPTCGKNEMYDICANGGCQKRNCTQVGQPTLCIDPIKCIAGCVCQEGFLRNQNGECVPEDECPPPQCTKPHEVYDPCPRTCPLQTCAVVGFDVDCPNPPDGEEFCVPACRCEDGYYRNSIDECILASDCLKCSEPNEYYSCGPACDNVCATLATQNQTNCPIINIKCNEKCYCDKGYARDDNNLCIPIEQCGVSCHGDPNAIPGCGNHCGRRCSNYNLGAVACPLICFLDACDCKQNYVFDDNLGKCVLPEDCTPVCGENEVYNNCINGGCQKKNCSNLGRPDICIHPKECIDGCLCKEGFLRAKNGTCVPIDECPTPVCRKNEVFDKCSNEGCNRRKCSELTGPIICKDPIECIGGCVCVEGNLRNEDGVCVPESECNPTCNRPHEVFNPCPSTYPPQTCESLGMTYICPIEWEQETPCQPGCVCEEGYFKNMIGECISQEDCLKCTGPNEYFSCGPACDNVCATLATQNQTNCPIKNKNCNEKCYCYTGYARDENNICIPIEQCGVSCHGDPNAIPGCGTHCGRRCSNYNHGPVACPLICYLDACDCKQNYVFDDNLGKCVLPEDCTPVCGENEVYNNCINGGCQKKNCSDLGRPDICIDPKECIDGCLCKEGFLRAKNGTCVPVDQCPTPVCRKNEVYDTCSNGGCNRRKCSELTGPIICKDPIECIGDCVCVEGYLRNEDGVCVPESECNSTCNRPHEIFNPCPSTCPPQTCESLNRAYICPIEWGEDPPCQPGCVCEVGYYKNLIGECISEGDCLKCMGPHEYFSCGGACDNVCETLNEQSQDDCPIINIQCNKMCYCEKGYARNGSNICIPIEECPPPRCGPNERYEENPCRVCEPLTCTEVGVPMDCPPVQDDDCVDTPGCICKHGLVRNDDGVCIPICECPSEEPVNVTEARARLDKGSIYLSGQLLHYQASSKPNENSVASATSVMLPLAQLALCAIGAVLEEILRLLNLKNKEEIKAVFPGLTYELNNQKEVTFEEASKWFANLDYPLSEYFKEISKKYFDAEGKNINFENNIEAAKEINNWVSDRTHGKIRDLVNADMFSKDTRLCLVNAIYFLGNWVHQFNPNDTEVKDFHKSNGETVPMKIMYQENTFNYAENDQFQVLKMLYKDGNFSFVVVLPRNKGDLMPTLKTIEEPDEFNKMIESLSPQKVQVYLPKMLINTGINVKDVLIKINASKMFDPANNGFEGLLEVPESVYVSDAVQKAYINVDELGTEAAAATALIVGVTSAVYPPPKIYEFMATRPFAFYILYESTESPHKTPLFCGLFVGGN